MYRKAAVLAAMVALGAAGCGGDSELTKAELIRQADVVCERLGRQTTVALTALGRVISEERLTQTEAAGRVVPRLVADRRKAADDLEGLEPPSDLSANYERYVDGLRRSAALLPAAAARMGQEDGGGELTRVESARSKVARSIGFKRCT
jgi:hypothetical protein